MFLALSGFWGRAITSTTLQCNGAVTQIGKSIQASLFELAWAVVD